MKPATTPPAARPAAKWLAFALVAAAAALAWLLRPQTPPPGAGFHQAAAAQYGCPRAQLATEEGKTLVRFLVDAEAAPGEHVYALAAARHDAAPQEWAVLRADEETGEPRYLAPLGGGWLYFVTAPAELPALARHAIELKPPPPDGAKAAGFSDGPTPHWLEPDHLAGLPDAARACSVEW